MLELQGNSAGFMNAALPHTAGLPVSTLGEGSCDERSIWGVHWHSIGCCDLRMYSVFFYKRRVLPQLTLC